MSDQAVRSPAFLTTLKTVLVFRKSFGITGWQLLATLAYGSWVGSIAGDVPPGPRMVRVPVWPFALLGALTSTFSAYWVSVPAGPVQFCVFVEVWAAGANRVRS